MFILGLVLVNKSSTLLEATVAVVVNIVVVVSVVVIEGHHSVCVDSLVVFHDIVFVVNVVVVALFVITDYNIFSCGQ